MSKQSFERLIRLEDEELGSNDDYLIDKDTHCKIPMIASQLDDNENPIPEAKRKQVQSPTVGLNFKINGSYIQMSAEQLKYLSLITLVIQNAALNLTTRAATTQVEKFSTSVAVTVTELLKLITCLLLIWYEEISFMRMIRAVKAQIFDDYLDTLKVAVPSFIYYIQNNLLYVGSSNLDVATSQVTYQLKILTTAVFSVLMLNKKLSKVQWASLLFLFVGVALIETVAVYDHDSHHNATDNDQNKEERVEKPIVGIIALLIACCLSGFAGVYFEKILKNTSNISIWIRNIQLSVVTIPIGLTQILLMKYGQENKGLFTGFTSLTWACIILNAQGGLLVAVVVKFANNILKGFATSLSIVVATIASIFIFNYHVTPTFVLGASLVIGSVMMYSK